MLVFVYIYTNAQVNQDTIKKSVTLDEAVVSANKTEEMKRNISSQIRVINAHQIQFDNVQTAGDILSNTGQIMVQKSQQGGGSPIIRGFEANKVLIVIDGVRMNNLIYRGGHLQNVMSIDPSILERVEVVFGPSSTIYGSDALGGTMHFMTKKPLLDLTGKKPVSAHFLQRYSSVNNGFTTHANVNIGGKKFASLTAITYNNFGDLKMGKSKNPFYDTIYGLREYYVERINGKDSMVKNSNKYLQVQSGYSQIDLLQKLLFKQNEKVEHQLNIQYSNSSNIPRYDRLTDYRNGHLRFAEWYYGPQLRLLTAYDLNIKNKFGFNNIHLGVNYQKIKESRVTRSFGNDNLDSRLEDVGVLGYNLDFQKNLRKSKLRFGLDGQSNTLTSTASRKNIVTNNESSLDTRYPDGDNSLNHFALYFSHTKNLTKKLVLNDGLRIGRSVLKSNVVDNSFFNLPVVNVEQKNNTYSGYLGLIYNPSNNVKLSYLLASGYRVPNIDDLSKIFETAKGNVIVPNPKLKPEQTLSNEIGLSFKPSKSIRVETNVWYTLFNDAITTVRSNLNGSDSIFYDGQMSLVYTNKNSATARIYGFSAAVNANITKDAQLYANFAYTKGEVTSTNVKQPLDHISPITGNIGYSVNHKRLTSEVYLMYNGKKEMKNYSGSGEDNQQYATKIGIPAWMTLNAKFGYNFRKYFVLQGGVENILDTQYRVFASGIHGPGRNIFIALRIHI
jgi:hemoglobin/transferrin/lactoferrin receptor protein